MLGRVMTYTRTMRPWLLGAALLCVANSLAAAVPAGWQAQTSPVDDNLKGVSFLDADTGWILAHETGTLLYTEDGGATWSERGSIPRGFREAVVFTDREQGWVCGEGGGLFHTTDSGATWAAQGPGPDTLALGSVIFEPDGRGLALGFDVASREPRALESNDRGASWQAHDIDATGGFTDAWVAAAGTVFAGGFGMVHRRGERGNAWQASSLGGDEAVRGLALAGDVLWAVGDRGLMARSEDGGLSWTRLPALTRARLRGLLFVDADYGYAIGDLGPDQGVLYETRDGGAHWRRIGGELPVLRTIARGGDRLWIVGDGGTILTHTLDPVDTEVQPADPAATDPAAADPAITDEGTVDAETTSPSDPSSP